ncbi:SGNH/GDSL hydrolase family protein [Tessaracoccus sp. Z1128]
MWGVPFVGGMVAGAAASALATRWLEGRRTINRHIDDYAAHWERLPAAGGGELRYLALGDSAAQGVGASAVSRGYVPRIAERLQMATGRDVLVRNLSVSGATSDDVVRDQLPQLSSLGFEPDLVTLDIGGNDVVYPGHNAATFEASLDRILAALPPGSFVADVPWFMVPGLGRQSQRMSVLAAALTERHGHHLVPLHRVSRETGILRYHRYTAGDFFHPNDQGYEGWAETFWGTIVASGRLDRLRVD